MSKQKYRIGEFSKLVGLSSFTLRYYEDEGLIKPHRDANGQRCYYQQDCDWLHFLMHLKGTGMSMSELKDYVRWRAQGDETVDQRINLLKKVQQDARDQILELENNLAIVSHKIDWYEKRKSHEIDYSEDFEEYLKRFN